MSGGERGGSATATAGAGQAFAAVALPLAIFLVALAARLVAPAPFVTWDEPTWTYRALAFTRAMERGDFAATWQSPHPGVVTLWAASAGITARRLTASDTSSDLTWVDALPDFDEDDIELLRHILPWHPAARAAIGWLTAALVALAAWILVPLIGRAAAGIAGLSMALDPFLLAHSRVLHLDAVLALLIACSALAIVRAYACPRPGPGTGPGPEPGGRWRWRWIAASGALGGLAALAKSPGAFAAGFAILVIAVGAGVARPAGGARSAAWKARSVAAFRDLVVWGGAAALAYVVGWPALWADPLGTLARMAGYAADAAGGAREAVYFMGTVRPDPGALFYAVAIPHRLTPLAVLGGLAGVVVAVRSRRPAVVWMLVLVVVFTGLMGRSAKKFERYDLPVYPALQIIAATGLVAAAGGVERAWRRRSGSRSRAVVAAAALVIGQASFTLPYQPYGLAYYNPLLGGGPAAAERLPVGWGEGADLVVAWLNVQPGAAESIVATPSMTLIGPGYVGRTVRARDWPSADRVVLYVDDVQIRQPSEIVEAFHGVREPAHVVRLNGIDYAWVYDVPPEARERAEADALAALR